MHSSCNGKIANYGRVTALVTKSKVLEIELFFVIFRHKEAIVVEEANAKSDAQNHPGT